MNESSKIKRPSFFNFLAEHIRVWGEVLRAIFFYKNHRFERNGDQHSVLVIPGFMGKDSHTKRLRDFINRLGYVSYPWGLGRNYGRLEDLDILSEKIDQLYEKHQQPVSLIGWSLGGVYARQLAKVKADKVRQIITLGSPINDIHAPTNATWLFRLIHGGKGIDDLDPKWINNISEPALVPTTAIYSKTDGIVPWEASIELEENETHQNIEVTAGHLGLIFDPMVWKVIANRLTFQKSNWERLDVKTIDGFA